jgi:hypothetical protein
MKQYSFNVIEAVILSVSLLTVVLHHFDSVLQAVVVEVCVVIEAVILPVPLLTVVLHHFDSVLQAVVVEVCVVIEAVGAETLSGECIYWWAHWKKESCHCHMLFVILQKK